MRKVFDKLPRKNALVIQHELKILFRAANIDTSRNMKNKIIKRYCDIHSKWRIVLMKDLKMLFITIILK